MRRITKIGEQLEVMFNNIISFFPEIEGLVPLFFLTEHEAV